MTPRLLLFSAILPLFSATAGWADAPIREIGGVQPKAAAFDLGGAEKPLMIQSADEAAKHFDAVPIPISEFKPVTVAKIVIKFPTVTGAKVISISSAFKYLLGGWHRQFL